VVGMDLARQLAGSLRRLRQPATSNRLENASQNAALKTLS
jgi:hypothetical protein